jgi:glycosyltransferase involved in cell wall biosynthesis
VPERPLLTVALPTCDGARYVGHALRGILAQQGGAFDLVVSDDRSCDETLEIVRRAAGDRARIVINAERLGLAGNWNRCVALSETPLVAVFHQDDIMKPGHLAAHLAAFSRHDGLGFVCGAADVIDEEDKPIAPDVIARGKVGDVDRCFGPGEFVRELAVTNPIRCSAVTIRKAAHAQVGGFDASYRYVVDWDFWLRVASSWPVAWLSRATVAIRWHGASETHRFKTGTADLDEAASLLARLYSEAIPNLPGSSRLRGQADRRLARAFLNRAYEAARAKDQRLVRRCLREAIARSPATVARAALDWRYSARIAVGICSRRGNDRHASP